MLRRVVLGLTIAAAVAVPTAVLPRAQATTVLVVRQDGSADFTAIQDAIDAASPGDTVEIADSATYLENVIVYRNGTGQTLHGLTLRAASGAAPVVDGGWNGVDPGGGCSGPVEDGSTIKVYQADDVTIEGLEVVNARGGVDQSGVAIMQTVDRLTLRDNVIHGGRNDGIQFADVCGVGPYHDIVIEGNEIFGFLDDEISDGAACIKIHDAIRAVIRANDIHDCQRGIAAYKGATFAMTGGEISTNRIHHIRHVLANGTAGAGDEGIKLDDGSSGVRIHRNEIWANGDNGIRLDNVIDIAVTHNTVWGNGAPGPLDELNQAGILIHNGSDTSIKVIDNIVTRSTGSGILVANADPFDGTSEFDYNNVFDNAGPQYRDADLAQPNRQRIQGGRDRQTPSTFVSASTLPDADFNLVCGPEVPSAAVDAGIDAGYGEPYEEIAPDIGRRESLCRGGPDCTPAGILSVAPAGLIPYAVCLASRDII
ncbi:MAG TPA: right-handed parallel beta-helix repeat-containing protein [Acidimicrobiia bacterium]|nr:right-handed parallel beta-helix repeat-containing protein [Acidimicrobiia bacterium]